MSSVHDVEINLTNLQRLKQAADRTSVDMRDEFRQMYICLYTQYFMCFHWWYSQY